MSIEEIYRAIGSIFCHQIAARSIEAGGSYLPFCARDSGIYSGFLFSALYIFTRTGKKADTIPPVGISILLAVLMSFTVFDGITSYIGIRQTTNEIRFITGILFGVAAAFFLVPLKFFNPIANTKYPVLKRFTEPASVIIIVLVYSIVLLKTGFMPWIISASISIAGFVFLTYRLMDTILHMTMALKGKRSHVITIMSYTVFMIAMYYISNVILGGIKEGLIR